MPNEKKAEKQYNIGDLNSRFHKLDEWDSTMVIGVIRHPCGQQKREDHRQQIKQLVGFEKDFMPLIHVLNLSVPIGPKVYKRSEKMSRPQY